MEIVKVADWEADFRDRILHYREFSDNVVIPTNIEGVQIRVIQCPSGHYLVSIEHTDNSYMKDPHRFVEDNFIIGCVELLNRNHYGFKEHVFEPHSFIDKDYRGLGYIESIYRWVLDNGFRLVSGDRQTVCSDGLWKKLAKDYEFSYFDNGRNRIIPVIDMTNDKLESYYTRKTLKKV